MKKSLFVLLGLLVLTGCGCAKKDAIIGTWKTSYKVSGMGDVEESYTFKEKGKCVRTIKTSTAIKTNCTYKFNKDRTQIKILWKDKLYKDDFSNYKETDKNNIVIGNYTYTKQENKKK